jgi:DNA-binding response OmpR family regulator
VGKVVTVVRRQLKILIVEDEALVAMLIEDVLADLGHEVIGIGGRLDQALKLAEEAPADFAIVDLNLNGARTYGIAEVLRRRGVPFIFATGYGADGVEPEWSSVRVLPKPFEPHQLAAAIEAVRV